MSTFIALAVIVAAIFTHARPTPHPLTLVSRAFDDSDIYANWPTYDELPLHPSFPTRAAWGAWGENDQLGALNHIRNTTILAAKNEIQLGRPRAGYQDDVITLNTQISTQFDGLKHFPYSTNNEQATYQFYNDLITFDDIVSAEGTTVLGIQNAAQKGIAGRGVLLDWAGWMESKNTTFDVFSNTTISPSELDEVAAWQGLNASSFFKPGDFLVVRTGFTQQYNALPAHEQAILPYRADADATFLGMEASGDLLRWLWAKKLSLVGSDNPAFEVLPNTGDVIDGDMRSLHQVFIGGWGMSIVEYLNLEELAKTCHELGRYSFFFTIQNLNVVGGIASPPNALAIV
ncbi:hypothetical protein R3P38DRAFT_3232827 [Favolaschia claudopus]|uniref:Cyclase n=1 Tax=Favolaschia claudopus TaxID=2862362 RepID=A0AAV9ZI39_9AGAR